MIRLYETRNGSGSQTRGTSGRAGEWVNGRVQQQWGLAHSPTRPLDPSLAAKI